MAKQIVVIGAGPAGIEAARTAAKAGARDPGQRCAGGRARRLAQPRPQQGVAQHGRSHGRAGRRRSPGRGRCGCARQRAQRAGAHPDRGRKLERSPGRGTGRTRRHRAPARRRWGSHRVEVTHDGATQALDADAIILAPGSVPVFPEGMRPDGRRILAPRFAPKLDKLPASTIVVGAGATGTEFVYLFNRLGVDVTWVVDPFGVLPPFDRDAAATLAGVLERRGVKIVSGRFAQSIVSDDDGVTVTLEDGTALQAEGAFLAIGRRADLSRLRVDVAGLTPGERGGALLARRVLPDQCARHLRRG
ncbi:MAG: FAD-dependent oxidoreductase [Caldilineaceae bacterium]